ncbi:MAG: PTS glucose transporter subunit IIA [Eubacteriales bacterium]|nr:PTS glucose transporter subunit IIA [Eubacteriales bacterium]
MTTAIHHFTAPITGKCVPIGALHTDFLGNKSLGDGVSIFPSENTVVAPCDGIISRVSESARIVTMLDPVHNLELLLSVSTESEHADCTMCVKMGEHVHAGTPLFTCNIDAIHAKGGSVDVSCIVTNLPTAEIDVACGDVVRGQTRILSCACVG